VILTLTKDLRVETSPGKAEFILQRLHTIGETSVSGKPSVRAGEEVWRAVGYFGSLESALHRAVDHHVAGLEGSMTLTDVVREIRGLKAAIAEATQC